MKLTKCQILERAMELCGEDNNDGICLTCGAERSNVEPDARACPCEACGAHNVYGAEELVLRLASS
jgi:hypothetical protein